MLTFDNFKLFYGMVSLKIDSTAAEGSVKPGGPTAGAD